VRPSRLLIIWLLQQAPIGSVEACTTLVPKDLASFSATLPRGTLPAVSGSLSLAGWVHLSEMRAWKAYELVKQRRTNAVVPVPGLAESGTILIGRRFR